MAANAERQRLGLPEIHHPLVRPSFDGTIWTGIVSIAPHDDKPIRVQEPLHLGQIALTGCPFTGQGGLVHVKIPSSQYPGISRDNISCSEPDQIPRDKFCDRQVLFFPVPEHHGPGAYFLPE